MYSSDHSDHPPSPGRQQQQSEQSPLAREFSTHRPCPGEGASVLYTHLGNLPTHLREKEKGRARWEEGGTCTRGQRPWINSWSPQAVRVIRSEVADQGLLISGCESNCKKACSKPSERRISKTDADKNITIDRVKRSSRHLRRTNDPDQLARS